MSLSKSALILNNIDRGTIMTALQTNGYVSKLKFLNSSVKNWESICKILEEDTNNEIIILGKFTEYSLFTFCSPSYKTVSNRLILLIKQRKHLIFIYKDNLIGHFSYLKSMDVKKAAAEEQNSEPEFNFEDTRLDYWLHERLIDETPLSYNNRVVEFIKETNRELTVLPYEKLIDIEITGQNFIENIAEGLLFRIYVPNDRIWSNEFEKFITLFRDYSSNIAKKELKITQNKTDLGVICSLYSIKKSLVSSEIDDLYKQFTSFMDLCASDSSEAEKMLKNLNVPSSQQTSILRKYVKESRRLITDLRQEREIKILGIKHRLENELDEFEISQEIENYIEVSVPSSSTVKNLMLGHNYVQNQTININPQIIDKVEGIVVSELNGTIQLNTEEKELSKLIDKFSKTVTEATDLHASLHELKDSASNKDKKRTAWQKLYGFLGKVGDKVGDVGVAILTKYIENQMEK